VAAAVYAASEGLRTVNVQREAVGGQAGSSALIRKLPPTSHAESAAQSWRPARCSRPGSFCVSPLYAEVTA
jgi:thioredoxin reductase (NADPH)